MPKKHIIPRDAVGIPTLLVEYLSLWGEEMEALSVLLATLIIGVILDAQGLLSNMWISIAFAVIVALEFMGVIVLALRRRGLEHELWKAVDSMDDTAPARGGSNG